MSEALAALIGALIGSLGSQLLQHRLLESSEANRQRRALVRGYLFQLQDAVEALWFRLNNLANHDGRCAMQESYFVFTTIYAFGRVLAIERLMTLQGIYAQLEEVSPKLGNLLREARLDHELRKLGFHQYDRLALAESVLLLDHERSRIRTVVEFRELFEGEEGAPLDLFIPAVSAIQSLSRERMKAIMATLETIGTRLANETKLESTISVYLSNRLKSFRAATTIDA